jgi:hypothetical protein
VCDNDHKQWVEAWVEDLLTTVDKNSLVKFRPHDVSKEITSLKLGKACGIDGIPNECLRNLPNRPLVHLMHLFNHCQIPYVHDYMTKWCRRQAEVILNQENTNVRAIVQGEVMHRKYTRGLNLAAVMPTTVQVSNCRLNKLRHRLLHSPALTEIPVYIRTKCWVAFCEWCVKCVHFLINPSTSGGIGCGRWTPIYIKKTNSLL